MGETMEQFNDEKHRQDADRYLEDYMGISEIGKLFHSMMKLWKSYENRNQIIEFIEKNKDQLYKIKIPLEQARQIAYDCYKSIGLGNEYKAIIDERKSIEVNIGKTKEGKNIWSSGIQEVDGEYLLNVTNHNSIETTFIISHEFMHAMTMYEEFNETKYLLREVCPHIIELILYEYIINNREKYNLPEEILNDLNIIRLMRFLNYSDKTNRCLRNDYIIALLIVTQLEKESKEKKIKILLNFMNSLEKNDVIELLESLGLRLNKSQQNNRKKYVDDMFDRFTSIFEILTKEKSKIY